MRILAISFIFLISRVSVNLILGRSFASSQRQGVNAAEMAGVYGRKDFSWNLRVALRSLEGTLLPRARAERRAVRILRSPIFYRRNQQLFLSSAEPGNLCRLERQHAARFYLRRQSQPVHHAYEEA